MKKDKYFTPQVMLAIFAVAVAGSVIYQPPYFYSAYYDAFMEAFGMTHQQIGLMIAVYGWGNLLTYIPGGILADKFSPKIMLVASLFSTAAVTLWMALSMNAMTAILSAGAFSITTCLLFFTAGNKAIRVIGGADHCATAFSSYYGLSSWIGFLFGMVQIWIYDQFATTHAAIFWSIIVLAASCFIAGVLVLIFYKEDKKNITKDGDDEKIKIRDIPAIAKNSKLWVAALLMGMFCAVNGSISYFVPYLTSCHGLSISHGALFSNLTQYGLAIICPIGGYIVDKVLKSTTKLYVIGFVLVIALLAVVIAMPTMGLPMAILFATLITAVSSIMNSIVWSILDEINIPIKYAATAVGLASMIVYAPDLFLYNIYGYWLDTFGEAAGYQKLWICTAGIAAAAIVVSFILLHMNKDNAKAAASAEAETAE